MAGRHPPNNEELMTALCKEREGPLPDRDVCLAHGVSPWTVKEWIYKGLKPDSIEPYRSFAENWEKAKIGRKRKLLEVVENAYLDYKGKNPMNRGDYKSAIWLLERMAPKQFGSMCIHNGVQDGTIDFEEIMDQAIRESDNLDALFLSPPPQMLEAMRKNANAIRALLDDVAPLELPAPKPGS